MSPADTARPVAMWIYSAYLWRSKVWYQNGTYQKICYISYLYHATSKKYRVFRILSHTNFHKSTRTTCWNSARNSVNCLVDGNYDCSVQGLENPNIVISNEKNNHNNERLLTILRDVSCSSVFTDLRDISQKIRVPIRLQKKYLTWFHSVQSQKM